MLRSYIITGGKIYNKAVKAPCHSVLFFFVRQEVEGSSGVWGRGDIIIRDVNMRKTGGFLLSALRVGHIRSGLFY